MQKPKPLHVAHADLKRLLKEWIRVQKGFGDECTSPNGQLSPDEIRRRIEQSAEHIEAYVVYTKNLANKKDDWVSFLIDSAYQHIRHYPVFMGQTVHDGTNLILSQDHDPLVFLSWQALCGGVYSFARSAAQELRNLGSKYPDEFAHKMFHVADSMDETAKEALECRKRGISGHLMMGSLSEYALEDARAMGRLILDGLIPEED
jgi:hypothetical protein